MGALARREGDGITLAAELLTEDGSEHVTGVIAGEDGPTLGRELAADLLARAPASVRHLFGG